MRTAKRAKRRDYSSFPLTCSHAKTRALTRCLDPGAGRRYRTQLNTDRIYKKQRFYVYMLCIRYTYIRTQEIPMVFRPHYRSSRVSLFSFTALTNIRCANCVRLFADQTETVQFSETQRNQRNVTMHN